MFSFLKCWGVACGGGMGEEVTMAAGEMTNDLCHNLGLFAWGMYL